MFQTTNQIIVIHQKIAYLWPEWVKHLGYMNKLRVLPVTSAFIQIDPETKAVVKWGFP